MFFLRTTLSSALLLSVVLPVTGAALGRSQLEDPRAETQAIDRTGREHRDQRVSFSAGSAERARTFLRANEANPDAGRNLNLLASALMSLGAGGDPSDLLLLERYAEAGKLSLRRAALFAIGEIGIQGFGVLDRLFSGHLVGAEEVALLALIRMDQRSRVEPRVALQRALDACSDPRQGVSEAAQFLREYALGGPAPAGLPALDAYYDLRWSAACAFGFVDGQRWKDLKLSALLENPQYLNRFVIGLAPRLEQAKLTSHLIELMAYPHAPGCAAGIVDALPGVIPTLYIDAGWRPASVEEWQELIVAIEGLQDPSAYFPLLTDALRLLPNVHSLRALRDSAALMLLEAGLDAPKEWINEAIQSDDRRLQQRLLEVGGGSGNEFMRTYAQRLLETTTSTRITIAAQLSLARLGDEKARSGLLQLFEQAPPNVRSMAIDAMLAVASDPLVRGWLEALKGKFEADASERLALLLALAIQPISDADRALLRDSLRAGDGSPAQRLKALKLLLPRPQDSDLALFRELFPVETDLESNLILARALAEQRDPHTLEALRHVLWGEQWNLSVLAGGICHQMFGARFLLDELATPPLDASDHKLRSVGFALGEWAGLAAVEELARKQTARDPALQGAYLGALSSSGR